MRSEMTIAEIIRASGREIYKRIRKEFYNADVQKISKKHDVNHYSMYSMLKASVGHYIFIVIDVLSKYTWAYHSRLRVKARRYR